MTLKCLGSGSSGNCYILKDSNGKMLMVEAGLQTPLLMQGIDFKTKDVAGCVVSHFHNDHSLNVKELEQRGVKVYTEQSVIDVKGLKLATAMKHKHRYAIGPFKVLALNAAHDVPCLCFLIEHPEMGKLFFATDTYIIPYKLKANHYLVECNYSDNALNWAINEGLTPPAMRQRLLTSHMELGALKSWFLKNDLSDANEIVLIHLSSKNSKPTFFKEEIEKTTGVPTYIAKKGLEIDLSLQPY